MSLERFCWKQTVTVGPHDSVQTVADRMLGKHVGALVVVTESGVPVGIITDRDVVCRVVARGLEPRYVSVRTVMTPDPVVAHRGDAIEEAAMKMRQRGIRRLPIVNDDGSLAGMVALDDLMVLFSAELGQVSAVPRENRGP